jgi:hypothetical protein
MILMLTDQAHVEQCVGRAIASERPLGATPVDPVDEFAGYSWYDTLPRIVGASFRIDQCDGAIADYATDMAVPPEIATGRVEMITLELAVQMPGVPEEAAEVFSLPADVVIIPSESWTDLDEVTILLSADCSIEPGDLASLLSAACFYPSEDCEDDSYHSQQASFSMQARFVANMLLLGEDTAIIERIREAVQWHVSWLIPKDRPIAVRAVNHLVEVAFADTGGTPAPELAQ